MLRFACGNFMCIYTVVAKSEKWRFLVSSRPSTVLYLARCFISPKRAGTDRGRKASRRRDGHWCRGAAPPRQHNGWVQSRGHRPGCRQERRERRRSHQGQEGISWSSPFYLIMLSISIFYHDLTAVHLWMQFTESLDISFTHKSSALIFPINVSNRGKVIQRVFIVLQIRAVLRWAGGLDSAINPLA